jgi:hypothetical protein
MSVISTTATILVQVKIPFEIRFLRALKDLRRGHPVILVAIVVARTKPI